MSNVSRWDPFRALRRDDDVESFFRDVFGRGEADPSTPPVEVAEKDGTITVKMVVPGVEKDQLDVSLVDDVLRVRGETRKETKESDEKDKSYHRQEIRYGAFERAVRLPSEVDAGKATAALKNGVLTITAPKSASAKAHKIEVGA